jgi:hypothetical protein
MKVTFATLLILEDLDEALATERKLHAAGYSTTILGDSDDCTPSVWMDVWRPVEIPDGDLTPCPGNPCCPEIGFITADRHFTSEINRLHETIGHHVYAEQFEFVDHHEPRELAYPEKAFDAPLKPEPLEYALH